jgi:hypothetical protein
MAMGHWCDGRASVVVGTHTHVPTADAQILPGGTAYQTDAGMCGDYNSVIGMEKDEPMRRFITGMGKGRFEPARARRRCRASMSRPTTAPAARCAWPWCARAALSGTEAILALAIVVGMFVLFMREVFPVEVTALAGAVLMIVLGIVPT